MFGAGRDGAGVMAARSRRRVGSDIRACPAAGWTAGRRAASAYDLPEASAGLGANFDERFVGCARLAGMPFFFRCTCDDPPGTGGSDVGDVASA